MIVINSGNKNKKESIKIKFQKARDKIKCSKERQDFIKSSKNRIGAIRKYMNHKKIIAGDWATFLNRLNKPTIPDTNSSNFDLRINIRTEISWLNPMSWLDKNSKNHPENIQIGEIYEWKDGYQLSKSWLQGKYTSEFVRNNNPDSKTWIFLNNLQTLCREIIDNTCLSSITEQEILESLKNLECAMRYRAGSALNPYLSLYMYPVVQKAYKSQADRVNKYIQTLESYVLKKAK